MTRPNETGGGRTQLGGDLLCYNQLSFLLLLHAKVETLEGGVIVLGERNIEPNTHISRTEYFGLTRVACLQIVTNRSFKLGKTPRVAIK